MLRCADCLLLTIDLFTNMTEWWEKANTAATVIDGRALCSLHAHSRLVTPHATVPEGVRST